MKLRGKFFIGTLTLIALSVLSVGGMTIYSERQILKQELSHQHEQMGAQLAKASQESLYGTKLIFSNFVSILAQERGFSGAAFVNNTGFVQFHSDWQKADKVFTPPDEDTLIYQRSVLYAGNKVGDAYLFIDRSTIQEILSESTIKNIKRIGMISLGVLFLALVLAYLFAKAMVDPIHDVVQGMRDVSKGRLDPFPFKPRKDELGWMKEELNHTIQKLRELEEMKRDFVAGVTHDLKSPLKAIQGFAQMLIEDGNQNAKTLKDYSLIIQNNATRVIGLIDDLLTSARIESGREELELDQFDIRKPIKEVLKIFEPLSREKKIPIHLSLPQDDMDVWADKEKTNHILTNLISNALKYSDNGKIEVRATRKNGHVRIDVADQGRGIPKQERLKIFEKFYRSKQNTGTIKGTGLGLFITKGFIELQNGKLSLTDNQNGGSVFSFTLPRQPQNDTQSL